MNLDDISTFIDLVKNPKTYEAKLAELKAYDDSIKANIQLSDDVADITTAKALAAEALKTATAKVASAQTEAETIVAKAQEVFTKRFQEISAKEQVAEQAIADNKALIASTAEKQKEIAKREKELAALEQQMALDKLSLSSKLEEVDSRLAKLRDVMN